MPSGAPFTRLCQQLARSPRQGRADLHTHTTCSDGLYTPTQVVDLAGRAGLAAVAITDHDTVAGVAAARAVAPCGLEIIPGVEITCEFQGKELHLLAYFVDIENADLLGQLHDICLSRQERFHVMMERLQSRGVSIPAEMAAKLDPSAIGRRHLAELIVRTGHAESISQAFRRYLSDTGPIQVAKRRVPVEHGIALVHAAGGVAAWAHPPYDEARTHLHTLRGLGLDAVEIYFPSCRPGHVCNLRQWALELGMAVAGGSDCHGPEPLRRTVGAFSVSNDELERLRTIR